MFEITSYEEMLLSHPVVPAGPIPSAQDPDGVYPYESFCETSSRPVLEKFRMISMENDRVRVVVCPDLGGRIQSLFHKESGRETLYISPVLRPVRILPRHGFIGGGIEVSFPISHTPVLRARVHFQMARENGRLYVWCGERELRFGMHWTVEYSLGEEDAFLTQRTLFINPTGEAHPWMSWSSAGVPARPDTEFHFPNGPVLRHGDTMQIIDWESEGPRCQRDVERMTGYFWREPDCRAFGVFTPSLGCGLYHVADPLLTPGIKLWTDGVGPDEAWVTQWTADGRQCLEIQAGPLSDQSIKAMLPSGGRHVHLEFWCPTDRPLRLREIPLPGPNLLPLEQVPRFSWARPEELALWEDLLEAFRKQECDAIPKAPDATNTFWAPSGMSELGEAMRWAAEAGREKRHWLAHMGIWRAGRDEIDEALENLVESDEDFALALAGRLYRRSKNDIQTSVECFRRIRSEVFALHPQVTVERDLSLEKLGPSAFLEREEWLNKTSALNDEWLIERRVTLLADQRRFAEAKTLLESTKFQLVHQRYVRTRLWKKIQTELALSPANPPRSLGEDDLAEFGAYREYQEEGT